MCGWDRVEVFTVRPALGDISRVPCHCGECVSSVSAWWVCAAQPHESAWLVNNKGAGCCGQAVCRPLQTEANQTTWHTEGFFQGKLGPMPNVAKRISLEYFLFCSNRKSWLDLHFHILLLVVYVLFVKDAILWLRSKRFSRNRQCGDLLSCVDDTIYNTY